jgi:hypothetical protein
MGKMLSPDTQSDLPRLSTVREPIQVKEPRASNVDQSSVANIGLVFLGCDSSVKDTSSPIEVSNLVQVPRNSSS